MDRIKVYLRKQAVDECRFADLPLPSTAVQAAVVDLHVEQTPAAGRARLTLESEAFAGPLHVDWDHAEKVDETWDRIIEDLQPTLPSVPRRLVLPCGRIPWDGQDGRDGLIAILFNAVTSEQFGWNRLASVMSARPFGQYPISSDGDLPDGLDDDTIQSLDMATEAAERHLRERLSGKLESDNHSLRFLTWQFRRCPAWLVTPLIDALEAPTGGHVFVQHGASRQLVYQALGRIAANEDAQRLLFDHLLLLPATRWKRDQLACAAQMLSRTDTAPRLLKQVEISAIGNVILESNTSAIGGNYQSDYFYTPFLMVELLRCRMNDPWTLVADRDPLADKMLRSTERVIADMERRFPSDARISRYRQILASCCDELRGEGQNPDILVDLASIAS